MLFSSVAVILFTFRHSSSCVFYINILLVITWPQGGRVTQPTLSLESIFSILKISGCEGGGGEGGLGGGGGGGEGGVGCGRHGQMRKAGST